MRNPPLVACQQGTGGAKLLSQEREAVLSRASCFLMFISKSRTQICSLRCVGCCTCSRLQLVLLGPLTMSAFALLLGDKRTSNAVSSDFWFNEYTP
jgi:hypothetical protein